MITLFRRTTALGAVAAAMVATAVPSFAQSPGADEEDVVVATVNGSPVYRSELVDLFRRQVPPQMQQMGLMQFYDILLDRLIGFKVLTAEGRAAGLADDPEVVEQVAEVEEQIIQITQLRRLIDEQLTDERLQAAYDAYVAENPPQDEVQARHILVETEEEAKEIIALLQAGGDFEELARERSTGPSGPQGGDLGYFGRGQMVEAFQDAAFALEKGSFTEAPVQTQFGWHVIKVEDKRTTAPESLETVTPQLREQVSAQLFQEIIAERAASADVERFDIQGNPVVTAPAETTEEAPADSQ